MENNAKASKLKTFPSLNVNFISEWLNISIYDIKQDNVPHLHIFL